jgi:RNA polymerase sigma factor (sigma-70 family)
MGPWESLVRWEAVDFDAFFRGQYRSVTGLAFVLCGDVDRAEDLAQEAFVAAHRSWERISRYDDPGAWVRRVVANKATSLRRTRSAEARALSKLGGPRAVAESDLHLGVEGAAVWCAVRSLPRRQAQVVALTFLDDLDISEVAHILQCGEATAKTHLRRAKATLAVRLGLDTEEEDR